MNAVLFNADPVGINFEDNTDEYDSETGTIVVRLKEASAAAHVKAIVYEEFCKWFDADTAGGIEDYEDASILIWNLWRDSPMRKNAIEKGVRKRSELHYVAKKLLIRRKNKNYFPVQKGRT